MTDSSSQKRNSGLPPECGGAISYDIFSALQRLEALIAKAERGEPRRSWDPEKCLYDREDLLLLAATKDALSAASQTIDFVMGDPTG